MSVPFDFNKFAVLLEVGRHADAEEMARARLAEDPADPEGLSLLSRVLVQRGRFDESVEAAKTAISLAPGVAFHQESLAWALLFATRNESALEAISEAIRMDPEKADAHYARAMIELSLDRAPAAKGSIEKALELDPAEPRYLATSALVALRRGELPAARRGIDDSLRLNPAAPRSHAINGWIHLGEKDAVGARDAFLAALRIHPNDPMARAGLKEALPRISPLVGLFMRYADALARRSKKTMERVLALCYLLVIVFILLAMVEGSPRTVGCWGLFAVLCVITLSCSRSNLSVMVLATHRLGCHALTRPERIWSSVSLAYGSACVVGTLAGALTSHHLLAICSFGSVLFAIPLRVLSRNSRRVAAWGLVILIALLGVVGWLGVFLFWQGAFALPFVHGCLLTRKIMERITRT